MTGSILALPKATDFTFQISGKLDSRVAFGSFSDVYRCTVVSSIGETEVAVKVFRIDRGRTTDKLTRAVLRELTVWLGLKHPNIVPLLGSAETKKSPLPALVSLWMHSGTLLDYLRKQATNITPSARRGLVMGIAEGLGYLHTKNVIHGDFHPGNILIDDTGNPRIADFGLATVVEDPELQWGKTTAERTFDSRWRAPEVLGVHGDNRDPERPTFESDVYSFGGVMFFIISGEIPWKGKNAWQISIQLSREAIPPCPQNIFDYHWSLIQECWSWKPRDRPNIPRVLQALAEYRQETSTSYSHLGTALLGRQADTEQQDPQIHTAEYHASMPIKNIVIFGETGAGKSSVINLMAGQNVAKISSDSRRCTLHWDEYIITFNDGTRNRVFDTVGLEGPHLEAKEWLSAITNAYNLIHTLEERGGINLLLFCIRGGRVTETTKNNYRLFSEFLCKDRVPLALVVTNLEREEDMEDWYRRNKNYLEKYNIRSIGHACITAAITLDGRHRERYEESRRIVCSAVQTCCNTSLEWSRRRGWFTSLFSEVVDFLTRRPKRTDLVNVLTRRCGMTKGLAQQVVRSIERGELC